MGVKMLVLDAKNDDVTEHINAHDISSMEIPADVRLWLEEVRVIKNEVQRIQSNDIGCSNIKKRYRLGLEAFDTAKRIDSLMEQDPGDAWQRIPRALGKIYSKQASTSAPSPSPLGGDAQSDFNSRDKPFNEALKFLQQDAKTRVIALCGMGGIGKTTMMERLREEAKTKKMFNQIVKAVVGRNPSLFSVQSAIADYTGGRLDQESETGRADSLCKRFENMLEAEKKILVILDDVWETFELKNIGLVSPLPNGVKLILTSRFADVCTEIAANVRADVEVVQVEVLEKVEARNLFFSITEISEVVDNDLYKIGCDIVEKCGGLPFAINHIATNLRSKKKPSIWRSTCQRLKSNDLDNNVKRIIEMSYEYLREKEREIFILCGLYPEDFNIPIEDLTRYAWGLSLFKKASTLGDARDRIETCVGSLKSANMLKDGDNTGCVKMHDLVLAFVVGTVYEAEDEWNIDHGDKSKLRDVRNSKSCKQISLSCRGKFEFPCDLRFPNLSILKLIGGDDSLKFAPEFYEETKEIEVIGYQGMRYPLLPTLSQYSPKLRTLCLDQCLLPFDYSCIGNLFNLEVLSFSKSDIRKLPSTFKNLKKLRLLDVTDCSELVIDDGVLGNLASLEELYMSDKKEGIRFNYNEVKKLSKNLYALEVGFFKNDAQPENMMFEKLERFKITVGNPLWIEARHIARLLSDKDTPSNKNTLMLVTNKDALLKSGIKKLIEKTEHLYLEMDGMERLEDVDVHPPPPQSSLFCNLRSLVIAKCEKLRYLFTLNVAIALSRLETLRIANCPVMESIIHIVLENLVKNMCFY